MATPPGSRRPGSAEAGAPLDLWSSPRPARRTGRRASFPENIEQEKTARTWRGEFIGRGEMVGPPRINAYPGDGAPECSPTSQAAKLLSGNWDLEGMDPDALKNLLLSKQPGGVMEQPTESRESEGLLNVERTMLQVQISTPPGSSEGKNLRRSGQTLAPAPLASSAPSTSRGGGGVWVRLEELEMKHALGEGERCMHGTFLPPHPRMHAMHNLSYSRLRLGGEHLLGDVQGQ